VGPGRASFEIDAATVRYRSVAALLDVRLSIAPGERVALVGPSGSGKTTLLRLLNGMVRPGSGRVLVDGRSLGALPGRALRRVRSRIGFIPQDLGLVPNLRVAQNVISGRLGSLSFLGSLRAMLRPTRADLERAHAILECVGIPEKLFERTDRLSGGQQQRVAIARSLMQDPSALLADEPVSAVDPARAHDTVGLLGDVSRERGLTLVMSLHNLDLAREFFPRLVGLRHGRVVLDRRTDEIGDDEFRELYRLDRGEMVPDAG
jgi:phosphonate transport system ATP-binding protein